MSSNLGSGGKCIKTLLVIFNVLFWMAGGALLGVGIWMAVDDEAFDVLSISNPDGLEDPLWKAAVYTMIAVGALVFVVGFLGFAGACCESRCMLVTYCVLTAICFAGMVAFAALAVVYQDGIDQETALYMVDEVQNDYTYAGNIDDTTTIQWDKTMYREKCCGARNYLDWQSSQYYDITNPAFNSSVTVPWTCCVMRSDNLGWPFQESDVLNIQQCYAAAQNNDVNQNSGEFLYQRGCILAVDLWFEEHSVILIGVGFGLLVIQLLGIIFAGVLITKLRHASHYA